MVKCKCGHSNLKHNAHGNFPYELIECRVKNCKCEHFENKEVSADSSHD